MDVKNPYKKCQRSVVHIDKKYMSYTQLKEQKNNKNNRKVNNLLAYQWS